MKPPPVLRFFREIVRDHLVDRGGTSALIPCVHDGLSRDVEFLSAGARRLGGALYNLSADDEWELPPGPISPEREALVQGALLTAGTAISGAVRITDTGEGVVAELEGKSGPAEPSLVAILRCAALISSSAYDSLDLIFVVAELSPLDPQRGELLWRMLTTDPTDLALNGRSLTLVPVLGASAIDPDIDYQRVPNVEYVVTGERLHRRSTSQKQRAIGSVLQGEGPIVLFLGAGASASARIPLGNTYRNIALEQLVGHHETEQTAALRFFDLLHERRHFLPGDNESRENFAQELTLERVLREVFLDLGFRPRESSPIVQEISRDCAAALDYLKPGRRAIRELAALLRGRVIIMTVNFDQLIEDGLEVDHFVYRKPEDYRDHLPDLLAYLDGDETKPVPILKLHGSIESPESLVATSDTTSAGLHTDVLTALNSILDRAGRPLSWLWIGCSMRDRDMNLWLGGLGSDALDEWWVDPFPGSALDQFFTNNRVSRWRQVGIEPHERVVIESSDSFLSTLAEEARRICG